MALFIGAVAASAPCPGAPAGPDPDPYDRLVERAEGLCREGEYARAGKVYLEAAQFDLTPEQARWVTFRLADTAWRAWAAAGGAGGDSELEEARRELQEIAADPSQRDRAWAEACESLGDMSWLRPEERDWSRAWPQYRAALEYWAASPDVARARRRYLDIVWRAAGPPADPGAASAPPRPAAPLEVLENARRIAVEPEDVARASYLVAMKLVATDARESRGRIDRAFEAVLAVGRESAWHDDALYHYARWLTDGRRSAPGADGAPGPAPDYRRAVELLRTLTDGYGRDGTPYFDDASERLQQIASPQIALALGGAVSPGAEVRFEVGWRNVPAIEVLLYEVDLTRDVDPSAREPAPGRWVDLIDLDEAEPVDRITIDTGGGDHGWGRRTVTLPAAPPTGAYVLVASGEGAAARGLLLVTDVSLVLRSWGGAALAWVVDAQHGEPIAGARVRLWDCRYRKGAWAGRDAIGRSDRDGICRFDLDPAGGGAGDTLLVAVTVDGRQAWAAEPRPPPSIAPPWRVLVTTDRPAYRPGETARWKLVARSDDGTGLATPQALGVRFVIDGPSGTVAEGERRLDEFGGAWGELTLDSALPPGEYAMRVADENGAVIGRAPLLTLLDPAPPPFEVELIAGGSKAVRLGEPARITVLAESAHGEPVAGAAVDLLVERRALAGPGAPAPAPGTSRVALRTDGTGRAAFVLETEPDAAADLEFRVEARVTDGAGRAASASTRFRATRRAIEVTVSPRRRILRPGEAVEIDLTAADAEGRPAAAEGELTIAALEPSGPGGAAIGSRKLALDGGGAATASFAEVPAGAYLVSWLGDGGRTPAAEARVWVADEAGEIRWTPGRVQLVADRAEYRPGEVADVLLGTPRPGCHVVVSLEGAGGLHWQQVVAVPGTARLLQVPIEARHVPRVDLHAAAVEGNSLHEDRAGIEVPDVARQLQVEITTDRPAYEPLDDALFTIVTRDATGRRVPAEVEVSLVNDLAAERPDAARRRDPRDLFLANRRAPLETQAAAAHATRSAEPGPGPGPGRGPETILWKPDLLTGESGTATVAVRFPGQPGTWRATARAVTAGAQFGMATATVRSRRPLVAELAAPRFLVAGDAVTVTGVLANNAEGAMSVRPELDFSGLEVTAMVQDGRPVSVHTALGTLELEPGQEKRLDWLASAESPGDVRVRLAAAAAGSPSGAARDQVQRSWAVRENGLERRAASSGRSASDATFTIELPGTRLARSTSLTLLVEPDLAAALADAIEVLGPGAAGPAAGEAPAESVEQVASRLLTRLAVTSMPEPRGAPAAASGADAADARRLAGWQRGEGGWGWWPQRPADHFSTGLAMMALCRARAAGVAVADDVLDRGARALDRGIVETDTEVDLQAWMLQALAACRDLGGDRIVPPARRAALDNLWRKRDRLNAATRALASMATRAFDDGERALAYVRSLENSVILGEEGRTAHWGDSGLHARWSDGAVEATALVLRALAASKADHPLIEPAIEWLLRQRRGAGWNGERATSLAVAAIAAAVRGPAAAGGEMSCEVFVNGTSVGRCAAGGPGGAPAGKRLEIGPERLRDGENTVRIARQGGAAPFLFAAEARYFVPAAPPEPAAAPGGGQLRVRREYFRLVPRATLLRGNVFAREPVGDGDVVTRGQRVEVVVTVEAARECPRLRIRDVLAAGLEPAEPAAEAQPVLRQVGPASAVAGAGRSRQVHRVDEAGAVSFFADRIEAGTWELRYTLRAALSGRFHALPLEARSETLPHLHAASDPVRINVVEQADARLASGEE